jgi:hypothetical protein
MVAFIVSGSPATTRDLDGRCAFGASAGGSASPSLRTGSTSAHTATERKVMTASRVRTSARFAPS